MEQYLNANYKYTWLMFEACKRLQLSSVSLYAASSIYHNFIDKIAGGYLLWKAGCSSPDVKSVFAVTSVYLASKLEEESSKIRDVVNVCNRILHPDKAPLSIGEIYWTLRDSVLNCELFLLRIIKFDAVLDYPHSYLLSYLNSLQPWVHPADWAKAKIQQIAWNLLQDSFHLHIQEKSEVLAVAILKLAVDSTNFEISNEGTSLVWWKALCTDATETKLHVVACNILQLLNYERLKYEDCNE